MTDPIISIQNVSFQYKEGRSVLSDISLQIGSGEFVALVGQNGAGKTTCAKLMNGILRPTSGRVIVNGVDTSSVPSSQIARTVGYCYQNPDHQIWALKVEDELSFGPRNLGLDETTVQERVEQAVNLVGLQDQRESYTFSLGWGQRQKLAVAAILSMQPQVIIVDEPTTGLDWEGSIRIMELLRTLNENGLTVLIISHDMEIVTAYAHRVVVFANGKIVKDGSVEEVMYDSNALASADLRPPQFIRISLALADGRLRPTLDPSALKQQLITALTNRSAHVNH